MLRSLVGSEMCIRDSRLAVGFYDPVTLERPAAPALLETPVTVQDGPS